MPLVEFRVAHRLGTALGTNLYEQGRVSNLILDIEDFLPIGSKDIEVGGDGLGRQ